VKGDRVTGTGAPALETNQEALIPPMPHKRRHERRRATEPGEDGPIDESAAEATVDREREGEAGAGDIAEDIESLRAELADVNNKWLRALADLDNYKKRIERDRSRWSQEAKEAILLDLLDLMDNFERAVACEDPGSPAPDDPFRQGVELILGHLAEILEKNGVRPLDACGTEFDPNVHEAVGQLESEDHESNRIVQEIRRGYMLGDRLLRCSRVIVAK
jgi:molecular chaperone GrpE